MGSFFQDLHMIEKRAKNILSLYRRSQIFFCPLSSDALRCIVRLLPPSHKGETLDLYAKTSSQSPPHIRASQASYLLLQRSLLWEENLFLIEDLRQSRKASYSAFSPHTPRHSLRTSLYPSSSKADDPIHLLDGKKDHTLSASILLTREELRSWMCSSRTWEQALATYHYVQRCFSESRGGYASWELCLLVLQYPHFNAQSQRYVQHHPLPPDQCFAFVWRLIRLGDFVPFRARCDAARRLLQRRLWNAALLVLQHPSTLPCLHAVSQDLVRRKIMQLPQWDEALRLVQRNRLCHLSRTRFEALLHALLMDFPHHVCEHRWLGPELFTPWRVILLLIESWRRNMKVWPYSQAPYYPSPYMTTLLYAIPHLPNYKILEEIPSPRTLLGETSTDLAVLHRLRLSRIRPIVRWNMHYALESGPSTLTFLLTKAISRHTRWQLAVALWCWTPQVRRHGHLIDLLLRLRLFYKAVVSLFSATRFEKSSRTAEKEAQRKEGLLRDAYKPLESLKAPTIEHSSPARRETYLHPWARTALNPDSTRSKLSTGSCLNKRIISATDSSPISFKFNVQLFETVQIPLNLEERVESGKSFFSLATGAEGVGIKIASLPSSIRDADLFLTPQPGIRLNSLRIFTPQHLAEHFLLNASPITRECVHHYLRYLSPPSMVQERGPSRKEMGAPPDAYCSWLETHRGITDLSLSMHALFRHCPRGRRLLSQYSSFLIKQCGWSEHDFIQTFLSQLAMRNSTVIPRKRIPRLLITDQRLAEREEYETLALQAQSRKFSHHFFRDILSWKHEAWLRCDREHSDALVLRPKLIQISSTEGKGEAEKGNYKNREESSLQLLCRVLENNNLRWRITLTHYSNVLELKGYYLKQTNIRLATVPQANEDKQDLQNTFFDSMDQEIVSFAEEVPFKIYILHALASSRCAPSLRSKGLERITPLWWIQHRLFFPSVRGLFHHLGLLYKTLPLLTKREAQFLFLRLQTTAPPAMEEDTFWKRIRHIVCYELLPPEAQRYQWSRKDDTLHPFLHWLNLNLVHPSVKGMKGIGRVSGMIRPRQHRLALWQSALSEFQQFLEQKATTWFAPSRREKNSTPRDSDWGGPSTLEGRFRKLRVRTVEVYPPFFPSFFGSGFPSLLDPLPLAPTKRGVTSPEANTYHLPLLLPLAQIACNHGNLHLLSNLLLGSLSHAKAPSNFRTNASLTDMTPMDIKEPAPRLRFIFPTRLPIPCLLRVTTLFFPVHIKDINRLISPRDSSETSKSRSLFSQFLSLTPIPSTVKNESLRMGSSLPVLATLSHESLRLQSVAEHTLVTLLNYTEWIRIVLRHMEDHPALAARALFVLLGPEQKRRPPFNLYQPPPQTLPNDIVREIEQAYQKEFESRTLGSLPSSILSRLYPTLSVYLTNFPLSHVEQEKSRTGSLLRFLLLLAKRRALFMDHVALCVDYLRELKLFDELLTFLALALECTFQLSETWIDDMCRNLSRWCTHSHRFVDRIPLARSIEGETLLPLSAFSGLIKRTLNRLPVSFLLHHWSLALLCVQRLPPLTSIRAVRGSWSLSLSLLSRWGSLYTQFRVRSKLYSFVGWHSPHHTRRHLHYTLARTFFEGLRIVHRAKQPTAYAHLAYYMAQHGFSDTHGILLRIVKRLSRQETKISSILQNLCQPDVDLWSQAVRLCQTQLKHCSTPALLLPLTSRSTPWYIGLRLLTLAFARGGSRGEVLHPRYLSLFREACRKSTHYEICSTGVARLIPLWGVHVLPYQRMFRVLQPYFVSNRSRGSPDSPNGSHGMDTSLDVPAWVLALDVYASYKSTRLHILRAIVPYMLCALRSRDDLVLSFYHNTPQRFLTPDALEVCLHAAVVRNRWMDCCRMVLHNTPNEGLSLPDPLRQEIGRLTLRDSNDMTIFRAIVRILFDPKFLCPPDDKNKSGTEHIDLLKERRHKPMVTPPPSRLR